jgi:hypothetical protein
MAGLPDKKEIKNIRKNQCFLNVAHLFSTMLSQLVTFHLGLTKGHLRQACLEKGQLKVAE